MASVWANLTEFMLQAPKIPTKPPPKTPSHTPKNSTTLKFNKIPPQKSPKPPQILFCLSYWAKRSIHKFKVCIKFFGYFAYGSIWQMTAKRFFAFFAKGSKWQRKIKLKWQLIAFLMKISSPLKKFYPQKAFEIQQRNKSRLYGFLRE